MAVSVVAMYRQIQTEKQGRLLMHGSLLEDREEGGLRTDSEGGQMVDRRTIERDWARRISLSIRSLTAIDKGTTRVG